MEEKILLDVEFNSDEIRMAIKNISEGRKEIDKLVEANKELAKQGQKNSVEYIKNAESIKALSASVNENSKVVQANAQANKANADSMDALAAKNKALVAERKLLSTETESGRKRIAEINSEIDKNNVVLDANISKTEKQKKSFAGFQSQLATFSPTLGNVANNLKAGADGAGSFVGGFKNMTTAAQAFGKVGILAVITLLVGAFTALQRFLFGSAEGMDLLEDITAAVTTTFEVLTDRAAKLVVGIGKFISGDFKGGLTDIQDSFSGIGDEIEREIELTLELNAAIRDLEDRELAYDIQASKTANTIKTLLLQSKNRTLSEKERIALLTKASQLEEEQNKVLVKNRADALKIANDDLNKRIEIARVVGETEEEFGKRLIENSKATDDQKKVIADAIIAFNNALGESISVQEKIQNQQDALAEKAEEAANKRAEAEKKRLEEIAKKREELRLREETAANELEILKLEKQAREIQGLENQTDKLIEVEQAKRDQLLENAELTESERQKIIFESEEAINEVLRESREREELERQASLERSLEDFQEYTQGLINAKKEELLQGKISKEEYDQEIADLDLATLETQALIKEQFGEQDLALQNRITDFKIASGQKELEIKKQQEAAKVAAVQQGLGTIASAFNKQSVAFKVLASVQTLITTYQSAIAAFNSLANIPYIGTILGIAAAAAATANGLAAVAKINSTQVPKMAEGDVMDIDGPRHSAGGVDVHVGNKRVANVEGGEKMVILKRGANPNLLKNLSTINALAGGKDFFSDRAPVFRNQDGGFVARAAGSQRQLLNDSLAASIENLAPPVLHITELERVQGNRDRAVEISDLQ